MLDVDAYAANRTFANLLVVRILNYSNLREAHRDVQAQIDEVLALISDVEIE